MLAWPVRAGICAGSARSFTGACPARPDALFELADAVLCAEGRCGRWWSCRWLREHRRGHGAFYAALTPGPVEMRGRLRRVLAGLPLPRAADGRLVLAVDVTCWLRPEAHTSAQRIVRAIPTAGARAPAQMIPGLAVLGDLRAGAGPQLLDRAAGRGPPRARATTPRTVTAAQVRQVVTALISAGHWRPGDPDILIVADAGYDAPRLAYPAGRPAGRGAGPDALGPGPSPRGPSPAAAAPGRGRRRHGGGVRLRRPGHLGRPAGCHQRPHPPLRHSDRPVLGPAAPAADPPPAWLDHDGPLPVIEGTVIRLAVDPAARRREPQAGLAVVVPHRRHPPPTSTAAGRPSCAGSTSSTPSACSSRPSAGPAPNSATPPPPTAGPG